MLDLNDSRWATLEGGYRMPYDASVPLRKLETAEHLQPIWTELWDELHHQGDVGVASYAAVPHIVRIGKARHLVDPNVYALAATIESMRGEPTNPPLPEWLEESYAAAWRDLLSLALEHLRTDTDDDNYVYSRRRCDCEGAI